MIEPMKFVSISGPRDDLDRMVNQVLCRYEIHLENALTELKSVSKLIPCPGTNPYREPYEAAEKLIQKGKAYVCDLSAEEIRELIAQVEAHSQKEKK